MVDKREQVLTRIFAVLETIPGVVSHVRNRVELSDDKRPALYLLDGDETADETAFGKGRLNASPNIITLKPEVWVSLENRQPKNENLGQDLNAYRVLLIKAMLNDSQLIALTGGDFGNIRYMGAVTDLARGRDTAGVMGLMFAFVYMLKPSEL